MEPLVVAGALAGGVGLAGLALFAAWRTTRPHKAKEPEAVEMEVLIEDTQPVTFVPPAPRAAAAPPPASPRSHPERAPAMVLTQGIAMADDAFSRRQASAPRAAPAPRPAARPPAPARQAPSMKSWAQEVRETMQPEVPTEWARRQVGPVEPGRVAGACGGCGARLSVSNARPLRIACPVCGRTKLIA